MIGFSDRVRAVVLTSALLTSALLTSALLTVGALVSGCSDDSQFGGLSIGVSPQSGTITPCDPTFADAWAFSVAAGEEVMISVDTTDAATAADFELRGVCGTSDFFFADDNFLCTFPPPAFSCAATVFTATAGGDCTMDVSPALTRLTPPSSACSDPAQANYDLFVDIGGIPAVLTQTRASTDLVCMGGVNHSRSCSTDSDCPGGSCEQATSLQIPLKWGDLPPSPIGSVQ